MTTPKSFAVCPRSVLCHIYLHLNMHDHLALSKCNTALRQASGVAAYMAYVLSTPTPILADERARRKRHRAHRRVRKRAQPSLLPHHHHHKPPSRVAGSSDRAIRGIPAGEADTDGGRGDAGIDSKHARVQYDLPSGAHAWLPPAAQRSTNPKAAFGLRLTGKIDRCALERLCGGASPRLRLLDLRNTSLLVGFERRNGAALSMNAVARTFPRLESLSMQMFSHVSLGECVARWTRLQRLSMQKVDRTTMQHLPPSLLWLEATLSCSGLEHLPRLVQLHTLLLPNSHICHNLPHVLRLHPTLRRFDSKKLWLHHDTLGNLSTKASCVAIVKNGVALVHTPERYPVFSRSLLLGFAAPGRLMAEVAAFAAFDPTTTSDAPCAEWTMAARSLEADRVPWPRLQSLSTSVQGDKTLHTLLSLTTLTHLRVHIAERDTSLMRICRSLPLLERLCVSMRESACMLTDVDADSATPAISNMLDSETTRAKSDAATTTAYQIKAAAATPVSTLAPDVEVEAKRVVTSGTEEAGHHLTPAWPRLAALQIGWLSGEHRVWSHAFSHLQSLRLDAQYHHEREIAKGARKSLPLPAMRMPSLTWLDLSCYRDTVYSYETLDFRFSVRYAALQTLCLPNTSVLNNERVYDTVLRRLPALVDLRFEVGHLNARQVMNLCGLLTPDDRASNATTPWTMADYRARLRNLQSHLDLPAPSCRLARHKPEGGTLLNTLVVRYANSGDYDDDYDDEDRKKKTPTTNLFEQPLSTEPTRGLTRRLAEALSRHTTPQLTIVESAHHCRVCTPILCECLL